MTSSLLIHNAKIWSFDEQDKCYENGAILIENGRIVDIIANGEKLPPAKDVINNNGKLLTPGLVDCHTHVIYGGNRASEFEKRLQGSSYQQIAQNGGGILSTVNATRQSTKESLFSEAKKRLIRMMGYGTTTCEIKSGYGLDLNNECKMLEVANALEAALPLSIVPTFLAAHVLAPEYQNKDSYIEYVIQKILPKVHDSKLSDTIDGFCETIGFSNRQIERILLAAQSFNFKIRLHAEQLSNQRGAYLAAKYRALSVDHLEYLSIEDIPCLKRSCTVAVLLPGAFYFLNESQKPPVKSLISAGVDIAISTDSNPGTSPFLSLPLIMNMSCIFFGLDPYKAFKGATLNAAKALGLQNDIGSIEIGKKADILTWKCDHYNQIIYDSNYNYLHHYIKAGHVVNLDALIGRDWK